MLPVFEWIAWENNFLVGRLERIHRLIKFGSGYAFSFKSRWFGKLSFDSFGFVFDEFKLDFFLETGFVLFVWTVVFILFCDILQEESWNAKIVSRSAGKINLAFYIDKILLIFGKIFGFLALDVVGSLGSWEIICLSKLLLLDFLEFLNLQG